MRLINAETLELEEFFGDGIPPYAILSHTWGSPSVEVSLQDVLAGSTEKPGRTKLEGCCRQAMKDGLGYAWIDTCCIDKTNSVELGEAINSMFQWYKKAAICYAYLSDVPPGDDPRDPGSKFAASRWFRRGWTLQELLAPDELRFYNSEWASIGTKGDLASEIEAVARIPPRFLLGWEDFRRASVAQRMSWAAQRETTRREDSAYCLLGIFDVTMPMIYGEGDRAVTRLQHEIMNTTGDHSILAWGLRSATEPAAASSPAAAESAGGAVSVGILAAAPSDFAGCGQIVLRRQDAAPTDAFDISGGYLRVQLRLYTPPGGGIYGLLNCGPEHSTELVVGVPLHKTTSGEYLRRQGHDPVLVSKSVMTGSAVPLPILMSRQSWSREPASRRYWLRIEGHQKIGLELRDTHPPIARERGRMLLAEATDADASVTTRRYFARFRNRREGHPRDFVVALELDLRGLKAQARCHVMTASRDTALEDLARNFVYLRPRVGGRHTASDKATTVEVTLKEHPAEEPMFALKLAPVSSTATSSLVAAWSDSVDVTAALRQVDQQRAFLEVLLDEDRVRLEAERLGRQRGEQAATLDEVRGRLARVQDDLAKLLAEQSQLQGALDAGTQQAGELAEKHEEARRRQVALSKQESGMQRLLDQDEDEHSAKQGSENWLEAMIQTLLDAGELGRGGVLKDPDGPPPPGSPGSPPLPDRPQPSKAAEAAEEGGRRANNGQTPLSWAVANGLEAVTRVLLEKGVSAKAAEAAEADDDSRAASVTVVAADSASAAGSSGHEVAAAAVRADAIDRCIATLKGHRNYVWSVAWSSVSDQLASASSDHAVRIWDAVTGRCAATLKTHQSIVRCVAWSPDGSWLASASDDDTVKIWSAATARLVTTLKGHDTYVLWAAWSADSAQLASASRDGTIKIWRVLPGGGACLSTLEGHEGPVTSVAWSANACWLASSSKDTAVKIWEAATGRCVFSLDDNKGTVWSVAWSPDADRLASGGASGVVRIWDPATGLCTGTLRGHQKAVRCVAWAPDASGRLASTSDDGTVRIWDAAAGYCVRTLKGTTWGVNSVAWSPDAARLVSGADDGAVKIWGGADSELEYSARQKQVRLGDGRTQRSTEYLPSHEDGEPRLSGDTALLRPSSPTGFRKGLKNLFRST